MNRMVVAGPLFALLVVAGGRAAQQPDASTDAQSVASAYSAFGFTLFSLLTDREATENVFISPSSVAFALAMTWNGASGETRQAMGLALGLQAVSLDEANDGNRALKTTLEEADPSVQLHIANSLWARKGLEFKPDFLDRNQDFFKAEITALDFGDPGSVNTINGWVSQNTRDKIPRIVDQIQPNSILFLINAIYFKGKWSDEFEKDLTRQQPFALPGGSRKQVAMMSQSGSYEYLENGDFQAIRLPYGNKRWGMLVFLPAPGRNLPEFIGTLDASRWESWIKSFRKRDGDVLLPRFRIEYEKDLNDPLKELGMAVAFDTERADFTAMIETSERAYLNKVRHKTFVEVNEEGTEAAAATSAEISVTSAPAPTERFRMVVDRPFLCAIQEKETGALLFLGAVNNPK